MLPVIFTDENIPFLNKAFKNCGKVIGFIGRTLSNHDLIENKCRYLIVRSTIKVNEDLLRNTNVEFVGTTTSGSDHIDKEYLKQKGILFADAIGSNANSVAEYVIYSILKWLKLNKLTLMDKTIGIIGFGNVGQLVAKYSHYLGLNIFVNDPPLKDEKYSFPNFTHYEEIDEIIHNSDIVTNHVPITNLTIYPTVNLINSKRIKKIKLNSLFIHASRCGVVDEIELLKRIKNNELTAIVDVWKNEPDFNIELAKESLISTPHVAGHSYNGKLKGALMVGQFLIDKFDLKPDLSDIYRELENYHPLLIEKFMDSDFLYESLFKSRLIDEDSKNLKELIILQSQQRQTGFDLLRKQYPIRWEIF
jgi:erythronate-4-phosphate dehydrogenase